MSDYFYCCKVYGYKVYGGKFYQHKIEYMKYYDRALELNLLKDIQKKSFAEFSKMHQTSFGQAEIITGCLSLDEM